MIEHDSNLTLFNSLTDIKPLKLPLIIIVNNYNSNISDDDDNTFINKKSKIELKKCIREKKRRYNINEYLITIR